MEIQGGADLPHPDTPVRTKYPDNNRVKLSCSFSQYINIKLNINLNMNLDLNLNLKLNLNFNLNL